MGLDGAEKPGAPSSDISPVATRTVSASRRRPLPSGRGVAGGAWVGRQEIRRRRSTHGVRLGPPMIYAIPSRAHSCSSPMCRGRRGPCALPWRVGLSPERGKLGLADYVDHVGWTFLHGCLACPSTVADTWTKSWYAAKSVALDRLSRKRKYTSRSVQAPKTVTNLVADALVALSSVVALSSLRRRPCYSRGHKSLTHFVQNRGADAVPEP